MSAQTVPCAHQETGTLCPALPVSPPPLLWSWLWHSWGTRLGQGGCEQESGWLMGTRQEIWDMVLGQAVAPPGALCPLEAGGCVAPSLVLATCQAGQELGCAARREHPALLAPCPAGAGTGTMASPWGLRGMGRWVQGEHLPMPRCFG